MRKMICAWVAAVFVALSVVASAGTANAADHTYEARSASNNEVFWLSKGYVTWNNRTAYISGDVYGNLLVNDLIFTKVVFDAFAGATKIDTQVRAAVPKEVKHFGFDIGDTNLPGGIDRIRVYVCTWTNANTTPVCGTHVNYLRP